MSVEDDGAKGCCDLEGHRLQRPLRGSDTILGFTCSCGTVIYSAGPDGSPGERIKRTAPFAHCDQFVLHAPKRCVFCDEYPDMQAERVRSEINFTGESQLGKKPCPSTERRSLDTIERWPGNRARKEP